MDEQQLFRAIEDDLAASREHGLLSDRLPGLIDKWQDKVQQDGGRVMAGQRLNVSALRAFRRRQLFVPDSPNWDPARPSLKSWLGGGRRGDRRMLKECFEIYREAGDMALLAKYPCHEAGQPYVFSYQGCRFTHRWLKHLYFISLVNRVLSPHWPAEAVCLDIGSSYGIFASLMKQEYPDTHHVLVDFTEQLLMARYFLGRCLPQARIAGPSEVLAQPRLTQEFLRRYDFVLLPVSLYHRVEPGAVDLITNFASLGEMSRQWFDAYLTSPVFTSARFFFTANRVESRPTYNTDVTILDYPIWDARKRLHFGLSPLFSRFYWYPRRRWFGYERIMSHPYFDYIGRVR
jgi:hypothetical protein